MYICVYAGACVCTCLCFMYACVYAYMHMYEYTKAVLFFPLSSHTELHCHATNKYSGMYVNVLSLYSLAYILAWYTIMYQ